MSNRAIAIFGVGAYLLSVVSSAQDAEGMSTVPLAVVVVSGILTVLFLITAMARLWKNARYASIILASSAIALLVLGVVVEVVPGASESGTASVIAFNVTKIVHLLALFLAVALLWAIPSARTNKSPVYLSTLVSLATVKARVALLEMQSPGRLFGGVDEESFERAQQFAALYAGALVRIYMVHIAKARKMRLTGVSWEEFDAEMEIDSGIVWALEPSDSDTDDDLGCDEFPVTSDMYMAYIKQFFTRSISALEKAIEDATHGQQHQAVDDYALAADQFVESIMSIAAYGETGQSPSYDEFLMSVNEFAARLRMRVQRICSQVLNGHAVTRTWD